jgi:alginate O-acetyltransferase complex protein AlgI
MVFSSLLFLYVFLPICLTAYYLFPQRNIRNVILIVFSLIFYAWGEPIWVSLLVISAIVDYLNGLFIERFRGSRYAKLGLYSSLTINLSFLATFKYSDFIVANVNELTGLQFHQPSFLLPIGISFYTFQAISYIIDVWKGEVKAQRSFINYLLFVSLFPQLCAGPIVRYAHIAKEIETRVFSFEDFSSGVSRFCKGLFKKVLIANIAGQLCVQFLGKDFEQMTIAGSWFGLLMYSLQIYFDFSGYSDMAIGLGRMFGFNYHENFNHPYVSQSITDFWRRWHMSLSGFFKDYVYIPLGGNRHHQIRNILIVWGLTGFWHGANWNFIIWGFYFAILLIIEKYLLINILKALPRAVRHLYAIFFIMLGWAIFYFTDVKTLLNFFGVIFNITPHEVSDYELTSSILANIYWLIFALMLCTPIFNRLMSYVGNMRNKHVVQYLNISLNLTFLITSTMMLVGQSYNPFIYFKF